MHSFQAEFSTSISNATCWRSRIYISFEDGKVYEADENFNKTLIFELKGSVTEFAPYINEMAMCTSDYIYIYSAEKANLIEIKMELPNKTYLASVSLKEDLIVSDSKGNIYVFDRKKNFAFSYSKCLEKKAINKIITTDFGIMYITKDGYLVYYNIMKDSKVKKKISDSLNCMAISPNNLIAVGDRKGTIFFIHDQKVVGKCELEDQFEIGVYCLVYHNDFYCVCQGFVFRINPDGHKKVYGTLAYSPRGVFLLNNQVYFFSFSEVQRIENRKNDIIEDLVWSKK